MEQLVQLADADAPLDAKKVPAEHATQDADPELAEYRPTAQATHAVALASAAKVPATQLAHMLALAAE